MDKALRSIKHSMDHTVLRHLGFNERNKHFVRSALNKQDMNARRKNFYVPQMKYTYIVVVMIVLMGALLYILDHQHHRLDKVNNHAASPLFYLSFK